MSATPPDTITVTVSESRTVEADTATAHLRIEGASLVRGGEAHRKAKEIAALANDLRAFGVEEDAIRVVDVVAHVDAGLLGKSSSVTYRLTVEVPVARLGDVVGVAASQKNLRIERVTFGYGTDEAGRDAWTASLAERALRRANAIAAALGVPVVGVHVLVEQVHDTEAPSFYPPAPMAMQKSRSAAGAAPIDPGIALRHEKTVTLGLTVTFRVGPRTAA